MVKIDKISFAEQRSRTWSGGVAVDVFCYPPGSTYEDWNFDINVSTAICEDLDSVFTPMEDTKRYLMVIGGIMQITHPNRYTKCMKPYESDSFMGDWGTVSKGKCNDFNLLCRNGWDGMLAHGLLSSENMIRMKSDATMVGFFPVDASLTVVGGDKTVTAAPRELIWVTFEAEDELLNLQTGAQPTNYVMISVAR